MSKCVQAEVLKKEGEDESKLIKRFLKKVQKNKIVLSVIEKVFYRKPSEVKRINKKKAISRHKKNKEKKIIVNDVF